jgi:hypothetical protein
MIPKKTYNEISSDYPFKFADFSNGFPSFLLNLLYSMHLSIVVPWAPNNYILYNKVFAHSFYRKKKLISGILE